MKRATPEEILKSYIINIDKFIGPCLLPDHALEAMSLYAEQEVNAVKDENNRQLHRAYLAGCKAKDQEWREKIQKRITQRSAEISQRKDLTYARRTTLTSKLIARENELEQLLEETE